MNRLAKNSIAAGLTTLLVTTGLSFSAFGADPIVAQSNSSAITGSNIADLVDTQQCAVSSTGPATVGVDGDGNLCGEGLETQGVAVVDQTASTDLDGQNGTSIADAAIAPIEIPALDTIDLTDVKADVENIQTGTVLDDIIQAIVDLDVLDLVPDDLLAQVQEAAVAPITEALDQAVPVSISLGAITSTCSAEPGSATGTSSVAGVDILVDLPGDSGDLIVPVDVATAPNSPLVGNVATQDIVEGLLVGLEDSLNESLNGVLGPLADVVGTLQEDVVAQILSQVGPTLIDPLGEALTPILDGTVNQQTTGEGSIEVTALSLNVLGEALSADLARTSCGPNGVVAVNNDDTNDDDNVADGTVADGPVADDTNADANADGTPVASIADADSAADADVQASLPNAGAPNLLPFFLLGIALLAFGLAVLLNERRRLGLPSSDIA